ncbi:MAG: InlB B-repeat-containing protein, partial [Holdemanella porci]|nr:InlB B-repeat-containing protein [Holdemanella porci]
MLKNLKKVAAIVLSFAMAVQFGFADSYYVNAVEEPVEPQQQEETTTTTPQEQEQVPTTEEETPQQQEEYAPAAEETNEQSAPETKSVELSYVAEDGTVLHETASRDFNLDYSLKTDSSVMLNFDGYTLKDVIINNSQTVPADQANLSVTSDLVSVKFVYVSVNTKEDKQTSENNEQTKTEEASEDDAEAAPETKEELPEYPAFDQSETAGNVVVHATAAEGVLPRDSKLVVKRITRKAILNAVEDTVSEKNKEMDSAVALDITIQNKDGVEIQPNGSVNISFENAAVSGDEINIYHVTDDASAVTEVATNTQSFDANHFSIYVITGENKVPLTTFNFVVNDTTVSKPTTVSTQIVKSGDTLIAPTAPDMIGQAFVGWVDEAGNPFTGFGKQAEITETTIRTITARYEAALYVYFLNPDGSQIMRTKKVGDHEAHDFTAVSYDVDSTHKLVGWADEANGIKNIADKITVPNGSTSVNVYAIIKEGYWVSFNSDGGSIVDSQFVLDGDNLVLDESTTPTKPGYTFDGWYNGSTKIETGATVTSPMTLTAQWKAAQVDYTINYWQQKVTDDKNATDAQKTYEYVKSVTNQATTGTRVSATDSQTYKGFKYNENNSSKNVEIAGDGTTIINVYYDRVLCTVNFYAYESTGWFGSWNIIKTETGLYGANLPEGAWDSSSYWTVEKDGGTGCILLTSFDFETAGYANNQGNITTNGVVTTCNFYRQGKSGSASVHYYNEQADGSYKLVQTIKTGGGTLTVHEKYVGYDLYKYTTAKNPGTSSSYWEKQKDVYDGKRLGDYPISIASKLKTYSLSYYNYNSVTKTEKNIKYTASLKSYENYTPAKPSELPSYYVFGGWYKDKACTTKFDFNTEKMPNANVQIYAKWTAQKINLTFNLNTPDGTSKVVNRDVDAGTIANTVLPIIPTINDYSFAGWYVADENGHMTTKVFNANDAILRDTNVIGKWLYNGELKVSYVADGVKAPKDNNVYAGGAKATVANGVTKEGKKFLGWQLVDGNVYQPGQNFEVNKELADEENVIILTARFGDSETSAILNYHPGNGNGEDQSVAILNNVEVTLKNTSDLRYTAPGKDYYFAGWATSMGDAEKGNAKYAVGEKVRVNADSSNDLYATWVKKTVIEVTANSNTLPYNGEVQKVEGIKDVTAGYEVTGLTAKAEGKDFGTYNTEITGTATVTKGGVDVTDKVIVNVNKGTLTISKRAVTLTSEQASKPYDGTPLTRPDVTITGGFVKGEVKEVKATGSVTNVSDGKVPNTITYETSDNFNPENYSITKNEGILSITPVTDEVTVTIKGNSKKTPYNGEEQSVSGYTVESINNTLYSSKDFTLNGQATATGKDANTYPMNLDATQFVNNNTNFSNVKFEIAEDGQLVITPVTDKVTVTIKGHEDTATYDGNPHSVEGYEVTNISNELYKADYIGFTGK